MGFSTQHRVDHRNVGAREASDHEDCLEAAEHAVPLRVLLVEDSQDDALLILRELRRGGYDPVCERVDTAAAMGAALERGPWDIVIADYVLPRFGGLEALALIQQSGLDVPFIVVSGAAGEDAAVEAMKAGALDYVLKTTLRRLVPAVKRELREAMVRRERKQVEEALRRSEERFALAAAGANVGIWDWDLETHELYLSLRWKNILGYSDPELPNHIEEWRRRIHPDDVDQAAADLGAHLSGLTSQYASTHRLRHKDGAYRWVLVRGLAVRGPDGEPHRIAGSLADITEQTQAEQALRDSQRSLEAVVETAPSLIVLTDANGRILLFNRACEELTGYSRNEVLGRTVREVLLPPEWVSVLQERYAGPQAPGILAPHDNPWLTKSGEQRLIEWRCTTVPSLDGGRPCILGTGIDVTERKRSEEALRQSQERFALAVAGAYDGLWDFNFATDEHYFSPRWKAILGYADHELANHIDEWRSRIHPDDLDRVSADFTDHLRGRTPHYENEHRLLHKDGTYRWVLTRAMLLRDAQSKPCRMAGSHTDITERKRAEQALRHRIDFEHLLATISRSFINLSAAETSGGINAALQAIGEFVGVDRSYILEFLDGGTIKLAYEWCASGVVSLIDTPEAISADAFPWWQDKRARFETIHVPRVDDLPTEGAAKEYLAGIGMGSTLEVPMVSGGGFIGSLGLAARTEWMWTDDDVTMLKMAGEMLVNALQRERAEQARRELEEQLRWSQRLEAIGRLAGGVAHDFNNLLTIIKGGAQFLMAALPRDSSSHQDAARINGTVDRAAGLVQQLLAFGRKQAIESRSVSLNHLLTDIAPMLRALLGDQTLLQLRLAPDLWSTCADTRQIEQVLVNLAANAKDAILAGGHSAGSVTIETANVHIDSYASRWLGETLSPGRYAMLAVSDTGCGMTEAVSEHIFEPFFTTKEVGKGTGLGLATAYGIVKQHRGHITCESAPGRGTTFRIYLPRDQSSREVVHVEGSGTSLSRELVHAPAMLLVVEDEAGVRAFAREVLQEVGYTVHVAGGIDEALTVAADLQQPIDLLVTDLVMPGGSGHMLARQLGPTNPTMKVLFMSGYSEDILATLGMPGAEFLHKPFGVSELLRKAYEILQP